MGGNIWLAESDLIFKSINSPDFEPVTVSVLLPLDLSSLVQYSITLSGEYLPASSNEVRDFTLTAVLIKSANGHDEVLAKSEVRTLGLEARPRIKLLNPQPIQIALDNGVGFDIGSAAGAGLIPKNTLRSLSVICTWP